MAADGKDDSSGRRAPIVGKSLMDRCVKFLEHDTKGFQIATYGITSVGLGVALYRIRPFARFTKPSDVPMHFVKLRVPLQGKVVRIEPNYGALVMVDHKPLIRLPRLGTPEYLPVKMAGVDVTGHGISWLQTAVCGKEITFLPIARKKNYLDCIVSLREGEKTTLSIGEELVRLGFGIVGDDLEAASPDDRQILAYKAALSAAQKRAKLERNGRWHFVIHPTHLWKLRYYIHAKLSQLLPTRISNQLSI